jgi:hypothetical protein
MRFTHELTYDADPEAVLRMLSDAGFREEVCRAVDAVDPVVSVQGSVQGSAGMTVVVDQSQPARDAPSFVRRLVGDAVRIVRREAWSEPTRADMVVEVPGRPARLDGELRLEGRSGSTSQLVEGVLTVRVPMIGGKVETLVADTLHAALRAEERVGRAWLARRR